MNISCHRSLDLVTRGREGGTLDTEKKGVYTEGGVMMTKWWSHDIKWSYDLPPNWWLTGLPGGKGLASCVSPGPDE